MGTFTHIAREERQKIEQFLHKRKSLRWIARRLDRSVGSISEEVKHNSVRGIYTARKADLKAYVARKASKRQCMKVAMDPALKRFVVSGMEDDQSPEGLSGRLKHIETMVQYASTKAIYKFIHSPHGRRIEKHLHSKAIRKKSGPKRGVPVLIDGRIMIDKRPKKVEKRLEFGHFEGDFIESGKDGTGSLLVLVERKTRYPFLRYLDDRSTQMVNAAVADLLLGIPLMSLTIDNDISFQKHEELSELLEATVFFCHPQSPHEKGTVENRNKAIRRYVPKRSDLSAYPKAHFAQVERKLRTRYMKCLVFQTPQEAFDEETRSARTKKAARGGILVKRVLINY